MPAHFWRPPAGAGPGLILVHEIFGVSEYIQARGRDLAERLRGLRSGDLLAAR